MLDFNEACLRIFVNEKVEAFNSIKIMKCVAMKEKFAFSMN